MRVLFDQLIAQNLTSYNFELNGTVKPDMGRKQETDGEALRVKVEMPAETLRKLIIERSLMVEELRGISGPSKQVIKKALLDSMTDIARSTV